MQKYEIPKSVHVKAFDKRFWEVASFYKNNKPFTHTNMVGTRFVLELSSCSPRPCAQKLGSAQDLSNKSVVPVRTFLEIFICIILLSYHIVLLSRYTVLHLIIINIIDPNFEQYFAVLLLKGTDIALYPRLQSSSCSSHA